MAITKQISKKHRVVSLANAEKYSEAGRKRKKININIK